MRAVLGATHDQRYQPPYSTATIGDDSGDRGTLRPQEASRLPPQQLARELLGAAIARLGQRLGLGERAAARRDVLAAGGGAREPEPPLVVARVDLHRGLERGLRLPPVLGELAGDAQRV